MTFQEYLKKKYKHIPEYEDFEVDLVTEILEHQNYEYNNMFISFKA